MNEAPLPLNNKFIIEKSKITDSSMIDYAKMATLLAFEEYPDDIYNMCKSITSKFSDRYNGLWGTCIIKNGAAASCYFEYYLETGCTIFFRYKDYLIKIYKISDRF